MPSAKACAGALGVKICKRLRHMQIELAVLSMYCLLAFKTLDGTRAKGKYVLVFKEIPRSFNCT